MTPGAAVSSLPGEARPPAHLFAWGAVDHRTARRLILPALSGLLTAILIWPVLTHAIELWVTNDDLHFAFLIPPLTLLQLYWQRKTLARSTGPGASAGLVIVIGAIGALFVCERLWARSPAAVAAGLLFLGIVIYWWGWSAGRALAFPIGWLTFGFALQPTLLSGLGFFLQHITAVGAAASANLVGVPVIRDGLVLRTGLAAFIVAEACSGMNSLLALSALAVLWLHISGGRLAARLTGLVSVFPLVVVANVTRVALVLVVAAAFGQEAAEGFFHGISSLVLFGIALGGFLLLGEVVGCRPFARA